MHSISRRTFLALSASIAVIGCSSSGDSTTPTDAAGGSTPPTESPTVEETPQLSVASSTPDTAATPVPHPEYSGTVDPFTLGVASGDPAPDSVILWTRLAPDPLNGGGLDEAVLSVFYDVSTSDDFATIVLNGVAAADGEFAHSVHVEALGLEPQTEYFYRFRSGTFTSPTGRAVTAPSPGSAPDALIFAAASCQNWENGYYSAHADIAASDVDLVTFLGDYIYEGTAAEVVDGVTVRLHNGDEPTDLAEYRNRYALYKSDPNLQAAHARCPWLIIWDDHEVENNYAADTSQDAAPATEFRERRAAAYRAWWEHMPVRLDAPTDADYTIYRAVKWGELVNFTLLDTRQYRTDQACNDVTLSLDPACEETFATDRTMMGTTQEQWLLGELDSSTSVWNVITQQVIFGNTSFNGAVLNYDQWDGYPVQRDRVLQHLTDAAVSNPVVLTGDIHFAGCGNLRAPGGAPDAARVGVEFVTTSISSGGLVDASLKPIVAALGDIVDVELEHRGWTKHTVTPTKWSAEFRIVDNVKIEDSAVSVYRTFTVAAGSNEAVAAD